MNFLDFSGAFRVLFALSWLIFAVVPVVLVFILYDAILAWRQKKFKSALTWSLLEIRVPRVITKGPQAMEQFFNNLHGVRNSPGRFQERWIDGEVTRWFSLEIVGTGGRTRFYLRVPSSLRTAVESMLYGHYPDIEIRDADDYTAQLPPTYEGLQKKDLELFATELWLKEKSAQPIANYELFETKEGQERIIDPMAVLLEMMTKLKPDESLWMQFLIAPAGNEWQKEGAAVAKELSKNRTEKVDNQVLPVRRTPGEELKLKLIERKITRLGFDTIIRYAYIAPKAIFNKDFGSRGVYAFFNQFVTDTNGFKKLSPKVVKKKKDLVFQEYQTRTVWEETFMEKFMRWGFKHLGIIHQHSVFSSDELATMIHMPTDVTLTAQTMDRTESKRLPPPTGLPQ